MDFDGTLGAGYSGGISMAKITASDSIAGEGVIAESNGYTGSRISRHG
jgi:hypothetical protein